MDEVARELGFEDAAEMNRMVASVLVDTPGRMMAFHVWKNGDGSKLGLLGLERRAAGEANG